MKSKIFAIMLAVMMVVSILPTGVFAAAGTVITIDKSMSAETIKSTIENAPDGAEIIINGVVNYDAEDKFTNKTGSLVVNENSINIKKDVTVIGADSNSKIITSSTDLFLVDGGELTLGENLTIESTSSIIYVEAGTINIDGAILDSEGSEKYAVILTEKNSIINVYSGEIIARDQAGSPIWAKGSTVNISGGTIRNKSVYTDEPLSVIGITDGGTMTITGSANIYGNFIDAEGGSTLTINGGNIYADVESRSGCEVTISGGIIDGDLRDYRGTDNSKVGGTILVTGGEITGEINTKGTDTVTVTGGTFLNADLAELVPEGYKVVTVNGVDYVGPTEPFAITYNTDGASLSGNYDTSIVFGETFDLPKATKRGHTFVYWLASNRFDNRTEIIYDGQQFLRYVNYVKEVAVQQTYALRAVPTTAIQYSAIILTPVFSENAFGATDVLPRLFDIKLSAGEGGTIEGFTGNKTLMVAFGASRTIDFVADEYYTIKNVNVNGYDLGAIDSYKIVGAYGQYNISVTFEEEILDVVTPVYTEDFSGETKWVSGGTAEAVVAGEGTISVKSTGGDPNINMPEAFGLACDSIDEIVVKYTNNTENTSFQIFFTNEANPGYSEAGSFKGTCAAGENEMVIKTEGNELWTGTLANMRIDLSNGEGEFVVDEITFNTVETMTAKEAAELAAEAETVAAE